MKDSLSKLFAGLLTLGVIGGAGGYLTTSLMAAPAKPLRMADSIHPSTGSIQTVKFTGDHCHAGLPTSCPSSRL